MIYKKNTNVPIFVVTIDTESDDAWENPEKISLNNIKEIPRFQELCEKYNIFPTYLLCYECAAREESISIFKVRRKGLAIFSFFPSPTAQGM